MKKILNAICLLFATALFFASCSKDSNNEPDGPDMTFKTEGVLCTGRDQLVYANTNYSGRIAPYDPDLNTENKNDMFLTMADGKVRIEIRKPYVYTPNNGEAYTQPYFAFVKNSSYTGYFHSPDTYKLAYVRNPGPETLFIIDRNPDDPNLFTIESNLHRGYYLVSHKETWPAAWGCCPGFHPVFTSAKAYWFFK